LAFVKAFCGVNESALAFDAASEFDDVCLLTFASEFDDVCLLTFASEFDDVCLLTLTLGAAFFVGGDLNELGNSSIITSENEMITGQKNVSICVGLHVLRN
jgi:hypothetical protein